jgi:hypothetical protein
MIVPFISWLKRIGPAPIAFKEDRSAVCVILHVLNKRDAIWVD